MPRHDCWSLVCMLLDLPFVFMAAQQDAGALARSDLTLFSAANDEA